MTMSDRLKGKVALVTGAASGIGRATCIRLVEEGASVFAVDIDSTGLEATAGLLAGDIVTSKVDVSDKSNCVAAVENVIEHFGKLDILANVAGIVRFHHFEQITEDEWNRVMAINLTGPMFLCQSAIPYLLEQKGNIVNVSSNAGLMGQAYTAAYCASKAGLIQLTKSLAMEYIKKPLRVNVVCPGGTETEMVHKVNFPDDIDGSLIERFAGLRGCGKPKDIASMIAYLASDEARMIHGAVISVDNGVMAG